MERKASLDREISEGTDLDGGWGARAQHVVNTRYVCSYQIRSHMPHLRDSACALPAMNSPAGSVWEGLVSPNM